MRLPPVPIHPYPVLVAGDKVKLADTRQRWTVRGVTTVGRFVILTKPFNAKRTVLYTVVDFDRGVRGKDDHYGIGYETDEQVQRALHAFQHTEDDTPVAQCDEDCRGSVEVSYRSGNHVRLDFETINGHNTDQ